MPPKDVPVSIGPGCNPSPNPATAHTGDKIIFTNLTGNNITITFDTPPGPPIAPPSIPIPGTPLGLTGSGTVTAAPATRTSYPYHCSPDGGIIIVDPGGGGVGPGKHKGEDSKAARARKPSKKKAKAKPKARPKAKAKKKYSSRRKKAGKARRYKRH